MEQQFKAGDTVELIEEVFNYGLTIGKDYNVIDVSEDGMVIHVKDDDGHYRKRRKTEFKLKSSNMELKITKDKVLAAAAKCSTAKATLETLFPEAFEGDDLINSDSVTYREYPYAKCLRLNDRVDLITAYAKQQGYKGLILNSSFNWELKKINGSLLLIPTRKTS